MIVYGINPVLEALRAGGCAAAGRRAGGQAHRRGARAGRRAAACRSTRRRAGARTAGAAACIRASWPRSERRATYSARGARSAASGAEPPAADRRARRHRGSAQRRRDPAHRRRGRGHGVVRQARHAAPLDGVGGEGVGRRGRHVRIATVVNIARALEELKEAGVWTWVWPARRRSPTTYVDFTLPTALVLGAEGTGCGGWCGNAAIGWFRSRCRAGRQPQRLGGDGRRAYIEAVRQRGRGGRKVEAEAAVSSKLSSIGSAGRRCRPLAGGTGRATIPPLSGWRSSVR